jgi:hypothetical protein
LVEWKIARTVVVAESNGVPDRRVDTLCLAGNVHSAAEHDHGYA